MKKNMFKGLGFALVLILVITLIAYLRQPSEAVTSSQKEVVKIGVTLPLTGNLADSGNAIKEAIMVATEEIPADSKYEYKIFLEDDAFNPKTILSNTQYFTDVKKVDVILSILSNSFRIIAPIAEANKTPNLTASFGKDLLKGYSYSFNHSPSPETQSQALFDLFKRHGYTNFSVIAVNIQSMQELLPQLKKDAVKNGIPLISETVVNPGTKDFRMDIEKIRKANPDVLAVLFLNPEIDIFGRQAKEQALEIPLTAVDQIRLSKDKAVYEGTVFLASPSGPNDFLTKLKPRINQDTSGLEERMYDWVKIIVHLYETADHKLSKEELREALSNLKDYPSIMGVPVSIKDHIIDTPLVEVKIENGQIKAVQ